MLPRVLLITRNLPPLVGGMERLNWHMADELSRFSDVRVVGPSGASAMAPGGARVVDVPLEPLWRFVATALWQGVQIARTWRPSVVVAGSGLTAPLAWLAARLSGARTAVYVHGLDLVVQNRVYRALWLPFIRRMDKVVANSRATRELAIGIGVLPERIGIVHPGVSEKSDDLDIRATIQLREERQLGRNAILLSVGRLSSRKGLREFVTDVLPKVLAVRSDVLLLIVGDVPKQALQAESQSPASILAAADSQRIGGHLRFLGKVSNEELDILYAIADAHVFPVQAISNDPEGFGMVAVEAAAAGLPTVAYATGGVVDAVSDGVSGYLVHSGDAVAMAEAILESLLSRNTLRRTCKEFAKTFAWPEFGNRLRGFLELSR